MKLKQLILLVIILLVSCFASFSLFAQIPTSGLVAYWPLNGNYIDAGPNGINGTNSGSTATTNKFGVANSAMDFNNPASTVAQYATHPINANVNFAPGQNFTISFLFYINTPWVHTAGLYDNNLNYNGPGIWVWKPGANPNIQFNYRNASVASTQLTTGVWQHVTCVRNSGLLSIYLNGVLNASGSEGSGTPSYAYPARFGTMFFHAQSPQEYNGLHGKLDELRIYNRALSASEISGLALITLPLTLGDFTATRQGPVVQLNWNSITEQHTSHFEIERSADGVNFLKIGRTNAAGNSNANTSYNFTDIATIAGTVFYRLKIVDIDRSYKYSHIVALKNQTSLLTLQLFPNPVSDILQIQIPSVRKQKGSIIITDGGGKMVYRKEIQLAEGNNGNSIPVAHLPAGMYLLVIKNETGHLTERFIKK